METEFICMEETPQETQKKIRAWISSGYEVSILAQNLIQPSSATNGYPILVTSIWIGK